MIKIQNLHKQYKFKNGHSINLELGSKGFVVLFGRSGSKALLNIIGGVNNFDSGDILVDNTSIKGLTNKELASYRYNYIGFVSDDVNLINELSISENIALSLEMQGHNKEEISKLVNETLTRFNLQEYKNSKPKNLSELEKQKVKIARAIVKNPKVLLVDGVINKLEKEDVTIILDILKEISKEKLVVMATLIETVKKYSDRVIEFEYGQIISDNIFNEDNLSLYNGNESLIVKKLSLPFRSMLNLTIKSMFKKKITTVFLILTLLFFGLATSLAQYDVAKVASKTFKKNGINDVLIYKASTDCKKIVYERNILKLTEVCEDVETKNVLSDTSLLKNEYNKNKYYEVRLFDNWHSFGTSRNLFDGFNRVIRMSIYDNVDQFDSLIIYGDKLDDDNDIYITDYVANLLIEDGEYGHIQMRDLIGRHITLDSDIVYMSSMNTYLGKPVDFKIAGIIDTDYEKYDYLNYLKYKDYDFTSYSLHDEYLSDREMVVETGFASDIKSNYLKIITTSENIKSMENIMLKDSRLDLRKIYLNSRDINSWWYYGVTTTFDDENNILLGNSKMPSNENEIVLPLSLIRDIPDIEELENFNDYLNKKITLQYDSSDGILNKELTIVGVFTNNTDASGYYGTIIVDDSLYYEMYLHGFNRNIEVELGGNEQDNIDFFQSLEDLQYKHITPHSDNIYSLEVQSDFDENIFYGLGFILGFTTLITMIIFSSSNINQRRKEIQTIRALGVKGIDIVKFFIIEGLIIGLISIIIAYLALSITVLITNFYVTNKYDIAYFLPYQNLNSVFIIIRVGLIISLILGLLNIFRSKKLNLI